MERTIYIATNVSCNLNCIYCYEDKSSKETFDLEATKQKLAVELATKTKDGTIIALHGGEPFMVFPKIKALCEWLWDQNFPEPFRFFATSNGTLIHGEIMEWLAKHKQQFIVGLSLDGDREMQNINRSNSFDQIDIDFISQTWPQQGIKMTISPLTLPTLARGIIFLHKRGIREISANLAEMIDWSKREYLTVYQRELQRLAEFYLRYPEIQRCSLFKVHFSTFLMPDHAIRKWCGVGTDMKVCDINGKTYSCHLFFESVCGKEKSEKAKDIDFSKPDVYISKTCSGCVLYPICPTCYGSNYIARGSVAERDMAICALNKVRFYEVARFEYERLVKSNTDIQSLSDSEKYQRAQTLKGLEKIISFLNSFSVEKCISGAVISQ